ncbi:MAG TPA: hypothetical protein VM841_02495 [Actinomycetota bacterium]|nr:hypothetical protein [Actinomycetota bacterium]
MSRAPHPRRSECPDDDAFVYTIAFEDAGALSVWAYRDRDAAWRRFHALRRKATKAGSQAQILFSFTHVDCDAPQRHVYEED